MLPGSSAAAFGSQGSRSFDPTRSHAVPTFWHTPGPGAYNDPRASVNKGSKGGPLASLVASSETHQFQSAAARFGSNDNGVPGPGEYRAHEVTSLSRDVEKKVLISRPPGAFGMGGDRFPVKAPADPIAAATGISVSDTNATPGPGNYDPRPPIKTAPKGETGAFASRDRRFRPNTAPPTAADPTSFDGVNPAK